MRINEVLTELVKEIPKAVFTKSEALYKAREIIKFVLDENETSEYEIALLNDISLSIEAFDRSMSSLDNLLNDVKFLDFQDIRGVLNDEIYELKVTDKYVHSFVGWRKHSCKGDN